MGQRGLMNKGYTVMEIAKLAHVSFTFRKKMKMKITGEVSENHGNGAMDEQLSSLSQKHLNYFGRQIHCLGCH